MNKGRILIVDDQEEILDSLGAILADEGHELIKARDGQEALHIVQSDSPDVVFLDIWIPGIDGMQTLKAIKRIDPRCSVIMMSGHGTIETAVKAIKLGATDYLEKPLNLEDVLHLVQKAISGRTAVKRSGEGNGSSRGQLIGASAKAASLRRALENAAAEAGAVWLTGEKGTGKEFLARAIHYMGGKDRHSLVKVRCPDLTTTISKRCWWARATDLTGADPARFQQASGRHSAAYQSGSSRQGGDEPLARLIRDQFSARIGAVNAGGCRVPGLSQLPPLTPRPWYARRRFSSPN